MSSKKKAPKENTPQKKLKREASPDNRPAKRVKYQVNFEKNDDIYSTGPFLVEFPRGPPSSKTLSNAEKKQRALISLKSNGDDKKLVAENSSFYYSGEHKESNPAHNSYFVVVHQKDSNEIKILPSPHPFCMEQVVKTFDSQVNSKLYSGVSNQLQRNELAKKFAGTRTVQALRQREESMIRDTVGMDSIVTERLKELKKEDIESVENSVLNLNDIPSFDPDTKDPSKVFSIKSVLSNSEYNKLCEANEYMDYIKKPELMNNKEYVQQQQQQQQQHQ
eukprot:TRINITY_DN6027_c1_g1_i1.p1 TRINITY_DN6027_c1_g1~~TRINITY_DN6027_c1_g1_i1.p1  ORF type:complete len:277 (-),score=93.97 TRINITY_DN6027_c1_g1_i1:648-1478(-)